MNRNLYRAVISIKIMYDKEIAMNSQSILDREMTIAILKNPATYTIEQVGAALRSILLLTARKA